MSSEKSYIEKLKSDEQKEEKSDEDDPESNKEDQPKIELWDEQIEEINKRYSTLSPYRDNPTTYNDDSPRSNPVGNPVQSIKDLQEVSPEQPLIPPLEKIKKTFIGYPKFKFPFLYKSKPDNIYIYFALF